MLSPADKGKIPVLPEVGKGTVMHGPLFTLIEATVFVGVEVALEHGTEHRIKDPFLPETGTRFSGVDQLKANLNAHMRMGKDGRSKQSQGDE
jgi:hypothetical protein